MLDILIFIGTAVLIFASLICAVYFRRAVYCYLFLFIPVFSIFLDFYVRQTGSRGYDEREGIPDIVRLSKDVVWIIILLGFLLLALQKSRFNLSSKPVEVSLLIFLGYMLLQFMFSFTKIGVFQNLLSARNTLGYIPAFFMAKYVIKDREDLSIFTKCLCCMVILAGFQAVYHFVFKIESVYYYLYEGPDKYSLYTFLGDYNMTAAYSNIALPFILAAYRFTKKRGFLKAAIISCVFLVLVSQSRSGLIVFVIELLLCVAFKIVNPVPVAGILILGLVPVVFSIVRSPEFFETIRIQQGIFTDPRFKKAWPMLLSFLWESPVFGHGFGVVGFAALRASLRAGVSPVVMSIGVDNFYLATAVNTGFVGLFLFFTIIISVFRHFFKLIRNLYDSYLRAYAKAVGVVIAGLLVVSIVTNYLESYGFAFYFWFMVGTLCTMKRLYSTNQSYSVANACCRGDSVS